LLRHPHHSGNHPRLQQSESLFVHWLLGGLEIDEALITLWDAGFDTVSGPGDFLARGEANRARRALGLATRRELASVAYWANALEEADVLGLLVSLGVPRPYEGGSLSKRAIHRLRAEARRRGATQRSALPEPIEVAAPPFTWRRIGHQRDIRFRLSARSSLYTQLWSMTSPQIRIPSYPPGLRVTRSSNQPRVDPKQRARAH
jgi:hypothetical protein